MRRYGSCGMVRSLGILILLLPVTAGGCSGAKPRLTISGSVSYLGKPVTAGRVRFLTPDKQNTWMADLQPNGTFVISDVFPGEVKVAIQDDPRTSKRKVVREAELAPGEGQRAAPSVSIPAKYKDVNTSDLKFDITTGTTELKIELK